MMAAKHRIFRGVKSHIRKDPSADGRTGAPWVRTRCGIDVPPGMSTRGAGKFNPRHHCRRCWRQGGAA